MADTIRIAAGDATAAFSTRGAEPVSWRVGDRELLWSGDPEHWAYHAPILFPLVGASVGGQVVVDGEARPMPQHGFARTSAFRVVEAGRDTATFRLADDAETRAVFPFPFRLDVTYRLAPDALSLAFEVANPGPRPLPYGLGFHPAFPWPFDALDRAGHRVVFEAPERAEAPEVRPGGLLSRRMRPVPLEGRVLPLVPEMFQDAFVFLDARSRSFAFEGPGGSAIEMSTEGFPHLAIWSRPTAPFLSLEAWTSHAAWEDDDGTLARHPSLIVLPPGESRRHAIRLSWRAAGSRLAGDGPAR